ncbi:MAG TPA: PadR family transcriptional regulator, partial [Mycobacteriales bacterium]
ADWFAGPVGRPAPVRDELAIKLALAVGSPEVDAGRIVQVQRAATRRAVQELTGLRAGADADADLAWTLVLDALICQAEAELRWLDRCERRVAGR